MKRLIGAAVAAALLLAAPAANAAIMLATYTGTASGHFHYAFGMEDSGTSDFVATLTFDTDLGLYETSYGFPELNGGDGWGYASPITAATLTINGVTFEAPVAWRSWVANGGTWAAHQLSWGSHGQNYLNFDMRPGTVPMDLTAEYTVLAGDALNAGSFNGIYDTQLTLFTNSLTVERISSAVPEPATWAMMIIGFGAVGSMARSSRRRQLVQ